MTLEKDHPRHSKEEYRRRYREIRKRMRERRLDVLVMYGDSGSHGGNQASIKYVSNYKDPVSSFIVFPLKGDPALYMSNRLYLPYAKQMSVIRRTEAVDYDPGGKVERRLRELGLEKAAIGVVGYRGILQTSIPFSVMDHWRRELKGASFIEATDLLHEVRAIKSKEELKWFRKGAALTDMAFEALDKKAREGMTDYELAAVVSNGYMPSGGGQQLIFVGSTSMARPHLIFPNQFPTHRKTRKGDIVLTELSADYYMHSGQAHRPIVVGAKPTPIYRKLYDVSVEAYERILRAVKPGAGHEDVRRAGAIIGEEGFTTFDTTFHGWGLLIENPRVDVDATIIKRPQNEVVFKEGMLMVIQPNVLTADGRRGLQVGNLVEVTKTGARSLQKFPMKFMRI
ncbi:MAG: M24 family metallopeptidase [Nitrospinota bacterium]|jgi:Xaa-Pro dipeptidase|nr:M24 family metallopeptidase [Nitrospinota bacterium]MDP6364606.1 M24 family metallopeptidase [Nitrospinota bacterium]MDP7167434.1 M24 family metallopeptidase [Nitrospinota bacterium]MDP7369403.1 M24 family metallopeptidase [Nitrospinota bacterium]MDP7502828.1 M24 family metallopeptidase [Nitrospinota bacterium]